MGGFIGDILWLLFPLAILAVMTATVLFVASRREEANDELGPDGDDPWDGPSPGKPFLS